MALPDIPRGRFTWIRLPSQGWVELPLQARLVEFVMAFETEHPWVRRSSMTVEERFSDTGVSVRVPFGPTGPPQRKDNFLQRPGLPLVQLSCIRDRDSRDFEVTLSFALGNDSPLVEIQLAAARESLREQEISTR